MIGSTSNIASLSKTGIKTGGTIDDIARLNVTRNKTELEIANPIGMELPEKALSLSPVAIGGTVLNYGVPISWVNYSATEQTFFADGIGHLKLFHNDYAYDASIVAPKSALSAQDVAIDSTLRPIANKVNIRPVSNSSLNCGGVETVDYDCWHYAWVDAFGNIHFVLTDNSVCDVYQALNEPVLNKNSYVVFTTQVLNLSTSHSRLNLLLNPPSWTPPGTGTFSVSFYSYVRQYGTPTGTLDFKVMLKQGNTTIRSVTYQYADLPAGTTAADADIRTITLTQDEVDSITDWTDLRIVIEQEPNIGDTISKKYEVYLSQVYMTVSEDGAGLTSGAYSYVYTYVRSTTGAESGRSPIYDFTHSTNGCISLKDILLSTDPTVDYINIYRTARGGATHLLVKTIPNSNDAMYEGGEGTDITSIDPTIYADGVLDCMSDVIAGSKPRYVEGTKRVYGEGLPPKVRYIKSHLNRIFGAGGHISHPYIAGTAYATNNQTTITGVGTHWTESLVGRSFKFDAAPSSQVYTVAKVDSETSLELTTVFNESTTNGSYAIKDNNRNPYTLYWSRPGFPEDWPSTQGITIEGETGDGITGLAVLLGRLIIFTKDAMYQLIGTDESSFQIQPIYKGVGCLSGHSIIESGNTIMFLDHDGWFLYNGGEPFPISSPDSQNGEVLGIDRTVNSINQARSKMACGYYNDDTRTYHNFVSLAELENNHSIVYDSVMKSWSIDDVPGVFSCSPVFDEDDNKLFLLGTVDGCIFQADIGTSDGVYTGTIVADVTSSTHQIITCSAANFDTNDGLNGCPAYLVDKWGNVTPFRIQSNSATELNVLFPLKFVPDNTYKVVVGVIDLWASTGWLNYGNSHKANVLQYIEVSYTPQFTGKLLVRSAESFNGLEYRDDIDLSNRDGLGRVNIRHKSRAIAVEIRDYIPGHQVIINNISHQLLAEADKGG